MTQPPVEHQVPAAAVMIMAAPNGRSLIGMGVEITATADLHDDRDARASRDLKG